MVIIVPAALGAILSLFSGVISLVMSLPPALKYMVFYITFLGLGMEVPGTTFSIGNSIISPLFISVFGFVGLYADYDLLRMFFGVLLLLYYAHFLSMGWGRR